MLWSRTLLTDAKSKLVKFVTEPFKSKPPNTEFREIFNKQENFPYFKFPIFSSVVNFTKCEIVDFLHSKTLKYKFCTIKIIDG